MSHSRHDMVQGKRIGSMPNRRTVGVAACLLVAAAMLVLAGCGAGAGANGASSTTVRSRAATVAGASEMVLTDAQGMTLYYFASDTATTSACTSACASTWGPLIVSSGTPTGDAALSGTVGVLDDANGHQVTYNGHPLYHYSGDHAPGDVNGATVDSHWSIATPSLNPVSSGNPEPTSPPKYGG